MAKDFYEILGVSRTSTDAEIKKAYRQQARKLHPDVNPGDKESEEKFKQLSAAFEVLSDPKKRRMYDEFGEEASKLNWDEGKAAQYRQYRSAGSARGGGIPFDMGDMGDMGDLFSQIFGRNGGPGRGPEGFGGGAPRGPVKGEDLTAQTRVTLKEVVAGTERTIAVTRPGPCGGCNGRGTSGPESSCPVCNGTGRTRSGRGPLAFASACEGCGGSGKAAAVCPQCGGEGRLPERKQLSAKIPPGVQTGSKVRLAGQGAAGIAGGSAGDLFIEVTVDPHPFLKREGDDLSMEVPITVPEAMLGAEIRVPTFDGEVTVTVPPGSQPGRKLRLRGKGVPSLKTKTRGDLYLLLQVRLPENATEEVRSAVESLRQGYTGDVRGELRV